VLAALVFGIAGLQARRHPFVPPLDRWLGVTLIAAVSGTLIGWTVANVPVESLGVGGWAVSIAWAAVAFGAPIACAAGLIRSIPVASFGRVLGSPQERPRDRVALLTGALLVCLSVLALQVGLMLVFDPRYVDFPFAPLLGAAVPFLVLAILVAPEKGMRPAAEKLAAGILAGSAIYIILNESIANWQALLFCAGLAMLAVTLVRVRVAPG
jgi:glucan 1,3-beta-glucosidase